MTMELVGTLYSETTVSLEPLSPDHAYAMECVRSESAARTRGSSVSIVAHRDASNIDEIFLQKAGNISDVLRPVECLIDYAKYRRRLRSAMEPTTDLNRVLKASFSQLRTFIEDHDGTHVPISWPHDTFIRLTSSTKLSYSTILESIQRDYKVSTNPLEVLGVILSKGQSLYSDMHPVLIISSDGRLFLHYRGRAMWNCDYDQHTDCEQLYYVAESLPVFIKEGLSRCDCMYTESGGAPYAMPEDGPLKYITSTAYQSGMLLMNNLSRIRNHYWYINGCPGMLKDRIFIVSPDVPEFVQQAQIDKFGNRFATIGRVVRCLEESSGDCEMYILTNSSGVIYGYISDSGKLRKIARNFDQFLRMGTRKAYFDFELPLSENTEEFTEQCMIKGSFFLMSKNLMSIKRIGLGYTE
nr:protein U95 [Mastomys natalensis cytomegalovirus 3]WEG69947.1 protein U95 [Mastomys natalensis cytomegalovirus 3]WEG70087.1 protein U95 [Mastomys natalensis cytomegalovirus 3]WEG70227.1 protein U95 [Mastomys natalensis cytomegalovirus 3]WEG70367.1 protein U95 [Mastomys natalensis cytomegalovirus 3]